MLHIFHGLLLIHLRIVFTMFMCRSFFISLFIFFTAVPTFSQQPVKLSYERNSNGDYVFYIENFTSKSYHVVVTMNRLVGLSCGCRLPFDKNVGLGKTQLFKLTKEGMAAKPDFSYSWSKYEGFANPKINDKVIYALPIKPATTTRTIRLTNLRETYGEEEAPDDFYAVGFTLDESDTIYAARRGVVEEIKNGLESEKQNLRFSQKRNSIRIRHRDNTVAYYSVLKNDSFMVEEGEEIEAGTPLALASGANYTVGTHVRMWVQYLKFDSELPKKERYKWGYVTPVFATSEGTKVLDDNTEYEAKLTEALIVQELSKRELKRRNKKKKNK